MYLFIHRKDLRVNDMTAFDYMAQTPKSSLHIMILDPYILTSDRHLEHSGINFLQHLYRLKVLYQKRDKKLYILYGKPKQVVESILRQHPISHIVFHKDITPYALQRDQELMNLAQARSIRISTFMDHTLVDLNHFQQYIDKKTPYRVFTPFYRKWKPYINMFIRLPSGDQDMMNVYGFAESELIQSIQERFRPPFDIKEYKNEMDPDKTFTNFRKHNIKYYHLGRDQFAIDATSGISQHLNVGAISIRQIYEAVMDKEEAQAWIRQLAWRDFYLYQAMFDDDFFKYEQKCDFSALTNMYFKPWADGATGIPIIDAAMTQLNTTGWMPNRLRMVTAMFLTKNLLCPFPYGENYFRMKLSDYDNILNRGGWLWSSSFSFDSAPYFRVMNPVTQSKTHDPSGRYIREWLPHMKHLPDTQIHLPQEHALVDLKVSRARAIEVYKQLLK